MLVGPAPFIVPKDNKSIFCLGSGYDFDALIEEYSNSYEEENKMYTLWHQGELKNTTAIREKYSMPLSQLNDVIKGKCPILKGSKNRLEEEAMDIRVFGNSVEIRKT